VARRRQETARLAETVHEVRGIVQRLITPDSSPSPAVSPPAAHADLDPEMLSFVRAWQQQHGAGCPLPELYRHLLNRFPGLTVGAFHDRLRALHAHHELRLSGMAGSLDALRDPELALLISSKVMYYANAPDRTA
jgi:hypothetical protein